MTTGLLVVAVKQRLKCVSLCCAQNFSYDSPRKMGSFIYPIHSRMASGTFNVHYFADDQVNTMYFSFGIVSQTDVKYCTRKHFYHVIV